MIVTVTRKGKGNADAIRTARYVLSFDKLPGRTFGPYSFVEAKRDLQISAFLTPVDARSLLLDAYANGSAQRETS